MESYETINGFLVGLKGFVGFTLTPYEIWQNAKTYNTLK